MRRSRRARRRYVWMQGSAGSHAYAALHTQQRSVCSRCAAHAVPPVVARNTRGILQHECCGDAPHACYGGSACVARCTGYAASYAREPEVSSTGQVPFWPAACMSWLCCRRRRRRRRRCDQAARLSAPGGGEKMAACGGSITYKQQGAGWDCISSRVCAYIVLEPAAAVPAAVLVL